MSDRREFLKAAARGLVGAALVGGIGWKVLGKGDPCWTNGACRGCPQLDGCKESEARLTRLQRRARPDADTRAPTGEEPLSD